MADEIRVPSAIDANGSIHSPTDQQLRRWEEEGGRGVNMNPERESELGPDGRVPVSFWEKVRRFFK